MPDTHFLSVIIWFFAVLYKSKIKTTEYVFFMTYFYQHITDRFLMLYISRIVILIRREIHGYSMYDHHPDGDSDNLRAVKKTP